jgi:hypothetical protein
MSDDDNGLSVPVAVAEGSEVCQPPTRGVYVPTIARAGDQLRERPRTFAVGAKGVMQRVRWSSWSGREVRARAVDDIAGFRRWPRIGR